MLFTLGTMTFHGNAPDSKKLWLKKLPQIQHRSVWSKQERLQNNQVALGYFGMETSSLFLEMFHYGELSTLSLEQELETQSPTSQLSTLTTEIL